MDETSSTQPCLTRMFGDIQVTVDDTLVLVHIAYNAGEDDIKDAVAFSRYYTRDEDMATVITLDDGSRLNIIPNHRALSSRADVTL